MSEVKVLLCGDVEGKFQQLFKRVETVNQKAGPFNCIFCVGTFFGADGNGDLQDYLDGKLKVPLPTYFLDGRPLGREALQGVGVDGVVCPNLTFLSPSGIQELHGLKVAYLAGRYDELSYKDSSTLADGSAVEAGEYRPSHTQQLIKDNQMGTPTPVDLFITNEWGKGVLAGAASPPAEVPAENCSSPVVRDLALELQPRYHVVGTAGAFYQREPYKNQRGHVTRFIALGAVGNSKKEKWLHALGLQPAAQMNAPQLFAVPPGSTICPYTMELPGPPKRTPANMADEGEGQYWRWQDPKAKRQKTPHQRQDQPPPLEGDPAFRVFVGNMNYRTSEEELRSFFEGCGAVEGVRIAIGDDGRPRGFAHIQFGDADAVQRAIQLTGETVGGRQLNIYAHEPRERKDSRRPPPPLPPGGSVDNCWFCLSNPQADVNLVVSIGNEFYVSTDKGPIVPQHMQIIPIEHMPSTVSLSESSAAEYIRYTSALQKCFNEKLSMGLLLFERYLHMREKGGNHCFVGALPIPSDAEKICEKLICEHAERAGFQFEVLPAAPSLESQRQIVKSMVGTREFVLISLPDGKALLYVIKGKGHPINFMREVAAELLGKPKRADWKMCKMSPEEEHETVENFKAIFKEYDIMD
mmetsp:Transcript_25623/g.48535  ORF Transcript_25623/g.48535 Transcript_25623/m.48535 type:complete len:637 (-) Transcript_25623:202-2112(-)